MAKLLTKSPTKLPPALDFEHLRQEGIHHIQRMAGHIWSEYNASDPGVTILDQLCYAITDLNYRIRFPMQDLLAGPNGNSSQALFSPASILPSRAVTLNDLRKLIIDLPEVKNAWVLPKEEALSSIYYDAQEKTLRVQSTEPENQHSLKVQGLYQVKVEAEPSLEEDIDLEQKVRAQLLTYRNLCEDIEIDDIRVLAPQDISIQLHIEMEGDTDPHLLMAHIRHRLEQFLSPGIRRYDLPTLLEKGVPIEEALEGPILKHGFILNEELQAFGKRSELRASDLIRELTNMDGVRLVKKILLFSDNHSEGESWLLKLDTDKAPNLVWDTSEVRLFKGSIEATTSTSRVNTLFEGLQETENFPTALSEDYERDYSIPEGRFRDTGRYYSIQHHFPEVYGVGEGGFIHDELPARASRARQLKGYLMFFDQLLANYFAQLAHLPRLFSFEKDSSYAAASLEHLPDANILLKESYATELPNMTEGNDVRLFRKNRFLNHLLARFSESFSDYALILYSEKTVQNQEYEQDKEYKEQLEQAKYDFLKSYPEISRNRCGAFDYTEENWGNQEVSGLKKRLCGLLGIKDVTRRRLTSDADLEYLREVLTTFEPETYDQILRFLISGSEINVKANETDSSKFYLEISCLSFSISSAPYSSEAEAEEAKKAIEDRFKTWIETTNDLEQEGFFMLEHLFLRPGSEDWGQSNFILQDIDHPDPFSLQISFVFPYWIGRFQDKKFQTFIEQNVREATPAHLNIYLHWMGPFAMTDLETNLKHWLEQIAAPSNEEEIYKRIYRNHLMDMLSKSYQDQWEALSSKNPEEEKPPLLFGNTYPILDLEVSAVQAKVAFGQPARILISPSQRGVWYKIAHEEGNPLIQEIEGKDGPIELVYPSLETDRTFHLKVRKPCLGSKPDIEFYLYEKYVQFEVGINTETTIELESEVIDYETSTMVYIEDGQKGVAYTLFDSEGNNVTYGSPIEGIPGQRIRLYTTAFQEDTKLKVKATEISETNPEEAWLDMQLHLKVRPNPAVPYAAESLLVEAGAASVIHVENTQASVTYQLFRRHIRDTEFRHFIPSEGEAGTVLEIPLAANQLDNNTRALTVKVACPDRMMDTVPPAPFVPEGNIQLGNDGTLSFPTGYLTEDTLFIVLATKTYTDGLIDMVGITLDEAAVVLTKPDPSVAVSAPETVFSPGTEASIRLSGTQPGVSYQLHKTGNKHKVGQPRYCRKTSEIASPNPKGLGEIKIEVDFVMNPFDGSEVELIAPLSSSASSEQTFFVRAVKVQTRVKNDLTQIATINMQS